MRILFVSVQDATDVGSWSGIPYYMCRALADSGADVVLASPLRERFGLPFKAAQAARNLLGGGRYSREREPVILNGYARQIHEWARRTHPDLILSPSSLPVARLETSVAVVFWSDATFAGLVDYYPTFTNLSSRHCRMGNRMEAAALRRASLAVYSSDWAAETAERFYDAPADKLAVVPFGANLDDPGPHRSREVHGGPCRLLLVGKGWHRKGADTAVATLVELRRQGVDATLDIVGSEPPKGERLPVGVTIHPLLDKASSSDAKKIGALYRSAAFFLLPSRADCTPIVLAEAAAYGLPVVASATGGMAAMVRDGRSGHLVQLDGFAVEASRLIAQTWRGGAHEAMATQARVLYEEQLNWASAARALLDVIDSRKTRTGQSG